MTSHPDFAKPSNSQTNLIRLKQTAGMGASTTELSPVILSQPTGLYTAQSSSPLLLRSFLQGTCLHNHVLQWNNLCKDIVILGKEITISSTKARTRSRTGNRRPDPRPDGFAAILQKGLTVWGFAGWARRQILKPVCTQMSRGGI